MATANPALKSGDKYGDLKRRLWFLLGALVVYRIGTHIPVPGINPTVLEELFRGGDGLAFFDRAKPLTVAEVAAELLEGGRTDELARRGFERVAGAGLWRHRAAQLVRFLGPA